MKHANRIIVFLLCACMIFEMLPGLSLTVSANSEEDQISVQAEGAGLEVEDSDEEIDTSENSEVGVSEEVDESEGTEEIDEDLPAEDTQNDKAEETADQLEEDDAVEDNLPITGTYGSTIAWTLGEEGTLTFSGKGALGDSETNDITWGDCKDAVTNVVIEEKITSIGFEAFYQFPNLQQVTLPKGLETIAEYSFAECEKLEDIYFEGDAPEICTNSFDGVQAAIHYDPEMSGWTESFLISFGDAMIWEKPQTAESSPEETETPSEENEDEIHAAWTTTAEIVGVWYDPGIENVPMKLHVTTALDAQTLYMYDLNDNLLHTWTAAEASIDESSVNKEWHITHTFEWPGDYYLRFKAANKDNVVGNAFDAEPATVKRPAIIDGWYSREIEGQNTEITIATNLEMQNLTMYLGEDALRTWKIGDPDVTVEEFASWKEWHVTYSFKDPGYYDLWYKASANNEDTIPFSKPATIKRPAIIDGWYSHEIEGQDTEITIATNLEMQNLTMYLGDEALKTWKISDTDVTVEEFESWKEWHVTYSFEYPGNYDLWYKASANNEDTIPFSKPVTVKRPAIIDVWYENLIQGEVATISVSTSLEMEHVYMHIGEEQTGHWSKTDSGITVTDDEAHSCREWTIPFTFAEAGSLDIWYLASADGEKMENAFSNGYVEVIGNDGVLVPPPAEDFTMQEPSEWTVNRITEQDSSHPDFTFDYDTENWTAIVTGYSGNDNSVVVPKVIWRQAVQEIEGRTEYRIEYFMVTVIGEGAFQGSAISEAILPNTIERIGVRAFASCSNLSSMQTYD